jgi:hypothetical protein
VSAQSPISHPVLFHPFDDSDCLPNDEGCNTFETKSWYGSNDHLKDSQQRARRPCEVVAKTALANATSMAKGRDNQQRELVTLQLLGAEQDTKSKKFAGTITWMDAVDQSVAPHLPSVPAPKFATRRTRLRMADLCFWHQA